ncbi:DUF3817 domain-containing protein [Oscillatoria laete-virens NRMC-F 0139]|nr:DUF3817 domain-containing protein [Oscillatoria laete-virens]MDL5055214.1 DUF3817 domain-containing protein [Oscillatoria laete-virens NRMC-F 0139]
MKSSIKRTRISGNVEGVSYLLLLGVAMPLKYIWDMPLAVKIVGWIHGILFIIFCFCLLHTWLTVKWPLTKAAKVFIAALLPFGPFILDHGLKREEQATQP